MRIGSMVALGAVLVLGARLEADEAKDPAAARAEAARLVESLQKDPGKRKEIAAELGNLGPPAGAAIPALAGLVGDRDEATRGNAVWALGRIAGPRYEPVVIPFTQEYKDKYYPPTEDWKSNGEPLLKQALPALKRALEDRSANVRVNAVYSLGCMEERAADAAPLLAHALLKDRDARVRSNAAWALTKVPGTVRAVLPALREATKSDSGFIRRTACIAMAWFGKDAAAALPDVLRALESEPGGGHSMKMNYFEVIAGMGEAAAPAVPKVAAYLDSKEMLEVANAAWCLGKIRTGGQSSIPRMVELLGSPDKYVRWNVAWALGRFGPDAKAACPELKRLSEEDPDPAVKANALQALSIISGVAVPTGSDAPEPTGAGSGAGMVVSSGDTVQVVK